MIQFGYWEIRGLAQPCRTLMSYCGMDFEDNQYAQDTPAPCDTYPMQCYPYKGGMDEYNASKSSWFDVKDTVMGDFPFPNLPYLIDGDVKLTQSNAILRYIARKAGGTMMGSTAEEIAHCEFMLENAMDFRNKTTGLAYCTFGGKTYEDEAAKYKTDYLAPLLAKYSKFLGDKPWWAGSCITACDFPMYELLDQNRMMHGDEVLPENIKAFMARFIALPQVKAQYDKTGSLNSNNAFSYTSIKGIC
jgi:glutathione S-transferase